ncbi:DUF4097 family beta strand repeat-containing protein [Dyadobacter psychrotolerans]|uniref:DUF4097 domain-containing protein n=1 Tax=Dyadobacter psychrotolerans TaxID=2541721 RepID=A0A4R5DG39_9BACT|nr:DUF4097 family beta strand repeat-containing protein [Dyadobacter psychrotolerans]TDE12926.1 hypothetical protein E0F88_21560 [Dyadobacter psychrotolerans]
MKRSLILSAGILLSTTLSFAQEYKTKLTNSKDRKVTIEMDGSDIKIEGYNGDEVIIQASSGFEAPPERAKGLKPLYYSAVDNSGIGLSVTTESGGVKIEKAIRKNVKYTIKLPRKVAVLYQETNWQGADISISNMDGDLEVKTNGGNINLINVAGPIVANTTAGEVKVVYSTVNQEKPSAISTISGEIDLSLPANAKSNLTLRSINGEMYTDFDLGVKNAKNGMSKVGGGNNIEGTTNGGGVEIQLKTISSNIYIRKQK